MRTRQNLFWKRHSTISVIYGKLPIASALVQSRRVEIAGHCYRAESEYSPSSYGDLKEVEICHSQTLSQGMMMMTMFIYLRSFIDFLLNFGNFGDFDKIF